ncbi:MAG: glycosyltransferase family 4 protein [Acidimicrobiia bacterium]
MRIAMVSPYSLDHPGGVQGQAGLLVEWLQEAGEDAWLVAPGESGGPDGTVYLGGSTRVRTNRSVAPIRLAPGTTAAVADAVAGADVVHIHEPFVPAVSVGALRIRSVPRVGTFHADPGRGVRFLYGAGRRALEKLAANLEVAVAVSPVAAAAIEPIVGTPRIIPNTIDTAIYRPSAPKQPGRIAFLGRDEPRKGLDLLLTAFASLHQSHPEAELVVMGTSRPDLPGVRFLGPVDDQTKRRELGAASVFVAPNTGGESFGLVVLEAMAAHCAVVASSLPAFQFVAEEAALYAAPGDAPGIERSLSTLMGDEVLLADLSDRAGERAATFDRSQAVSEYLKVYSEAVEKRGD